MCSVRVSITRTAPSDLPIFSAISFVGSPSTYRHRSTSRLSAGSWAMAAFNIFCRSLRANAWLALVRLAAKRSISSRLAPGGAAWADTSRSAARLRAANRRWASMIRCSATWHSQPNGSRSPRSSVGQAFRAATAVSW